VRTRTAAGRAGAGLLAAGLVLGLAPAASAHPDHGGAAVSDGAVDDARTAHEQHEGQDGHLPPVNRNVQLIGKVEIAGVQEDQIADVTAFGDHAYLASFRTDDCDSGGVYTVDITDPARPVERGFLPTSFGSYVGEGMQVIDVRNPRFTGQLLLFNNETNPDCDTEEAQAETGGMTIVDVTNPRNPVVLAEHVGDRDGGDGTDQGYTNDIHSVFGWNDDGKTYAVLVDDEEETDVDIMDITDPRNPVLIVEYDLDEEFEVAQEELGDGSSFLHDMVVKEIGGVQTMLASYWDGGYVQLNVENPRDIRLINHTDFTVPDPERAKRGESVLPEGNAHQAEYTRDNRFFVATDEDFNPFKLKATFANGSEFDVAVASDGLQVAPGSTVTGPTTFVGSACANDPVPAATSADQVAVAERGGCTFKEKADSAAAAGYDTLIIFNTKAPADGSDPDSLLSPTAANEDIRVIFVGRADGLRILKSFDESKPSTEQDAPAVGTQGQAVTVRSFFDGWGYVHLYDRATAKDVGTYAVPESQDPAFAQGFGDLSVHEVAIDPTQDISYLSYYGAGLRIVSQGGRGLQEIGAFIDQGGNDFWGVEVHQSRTQGQVVLASDRDYGLYVFKYARPAAAARAINDSCPDGQVPANRFSDVAAGGTHSTSIRCVDWYDIAQGFADGTFRPAAGVTRGAMASFIGRTILRGGGTLPGNPRDAFTDDNGSVHERFINRLAAAGVVLGRPDGTYRPNEIVTRGQMATFLANAYKQIVGSELPAQSDFFDDDKESTHEVNINRVAGAGIAAGTTGTTFAPNAGTERGQMATFLSRLLDVLVEQGETSSPR
jgi:hypothetical protein